MNNRIFRDYQCAASSWEETRKGLREIVFTNGCFDILHAGHVKCLEQARSFGQFLVVGLNGDASITRLKGPERPINSFLDRATVLAALRAVDLVIGFDEDTPAKLIQAIDPQVLVKGGDWSVESIAGADWVQSRGGRVVTIPLVAGRSTTRTIEKLRK